jgi:predicted RNA-binding protein with PIN domain
MRIIDGYNVIGAASEFGLDLSQPDKEERLVRLLSSYRARRRSRQALLVVFDGHHGRLAAGPRRYSHLGVGVEWSLGETADAVIARKVRGASRAREIEVVTSDRQLLDSIASWGAKGTRSPDFLAEVSRALEDAPGAEKPETSTPDEVSEWLDRFGDGR